jgi:CRISPR/Cas system endoribonuclease Cas6 (RAMP superfamily)
MRAEQTVSEMVVEVLARQADKLADRSDQPFQEAFEEVLKTEAGQQLAELAEGRQRHEKAIYWQANLLFERVSEQAGHPVTRPRDRRF